VTPYAALPNTNPEHVLSLLKAGREALKRKLNAAIVRKDALAVSRLENELHEYDADIRQLEENNGVTYRREGN
jgi:hypothetical protein